MLVATKPSTPTIMPISSPDAKPPPPPLLLLVALLLLSLEPELLPPAGAVGPKLDELDLLPEEGVDAGVATASRVKPFDVQ